MGQIAVAIDREMAALRRCIMYEANNYQRPEKKARKGRNTILEKKFQDPAEILTWDLV